MIINPELKAQIESDIEACENHKEKAGSEQLYSELVARYVVIDPSFTDKLSTDGKITTVGSEYDYRPELHAISSKLKMYLLSSVVPDALISPLQNRVIDFIERGEKIGKEEFHPASNGFALSYIGGPNYDSWMSEINIFNDRYLGKHPLYHSIHSAFFHRNTNPSAHSNMMGYLHALASDNDFWNSYMPKEDKMLTHTRKTIDQLLTEDIERCDEFLENPVDEKAGQKIYIDITGRYDNIINGLGNGLYQYIADQHFYDPEVSGESLVHNLQVLRGKMESYQATHSSVKGVEKEKKDSSMLYDVFISHANADKLEYIEQLKQSLDKLRIRVFYDKDTLEWGDKWKDKILEGVEKAEFAIIVISENFFGREWTERELNEFLNRQNSSGQKVILPILHKITVSQLMEKYPAIADIQALNSEKYTCDEIALLFASQLIKRLKG